MFFSCHRLYLYATPCLPPATTQFRIAFLSAAINFKSTMMPLVVVIVSQTSRSSLDAILFFSHLLDAPALAMFVRCFLVRDFARALPPLRLNSFMLIVMRLPPLQPRQLP